MAHAQKPDFVFRRNVRIHLNQQGRQFNRLLAAEVCVSAVVMLDTPCSEEVRRVLATPSIRQFPPSLPLPCVAMSHHISTGFYHKPANGGDSIVFSCSAKCEELHNSWNLHCCQIKENFFFNNATVTSGRRKFV